MIVVVTMMDRLWPHGGSRNAVEKAIVHDGCASVCQRHVRIFLRRESFRLLPVLFLIVSCVISMIYTGGFFEGESFIDSFANSDASYGLPLGSLVTLFFIFILYLPRRIINFKEFMSCIPAGFIAMVPAILILSFAWALSSMTGLMGGAGIRCRPVEGSAPVSDVPAAIIFLSPVAWHFRRGRRETFGILIHRRQLPSAASPRRRSWYVRPAWRALCPATTARFRIR